MTNGCLALNCLSPSSGLLGSSRPVAILFVWSQALPEVLSKLPCNHPAAGADLRSRRQDFWNSPCVTCMERYLPFESVWLRSWGVFDLPALEKRIAEAEKLASEPGFWDDSRRAQRRMQALASMKAELEAWSEVDSSTANLEELITLAIGESDDSMAEQLHIEFERLLPKVQELEFKLQLSGEYDDRPAILAVKSGAGGVDAQDWAEMLFRMYCRWAEKQGFGVEVLDETAGDEAGVKSAVVKIDGRYAYGYLRSERGVHRLVRLSPFDSDHRRHTSFALIEVLPEADEEEDVTIHPDDIRLDVFRAGGHGGQNVQKNSTAVRITHLPSGLVVAVQNERSQLQNRDVAMRILHSRLVDLEMRRRADAREELKGAHVAAEFGRQVRSYVLHPYQMVNDHRSDFKTGDAQGVLEGDIDELLRASLTSQVGEPASASE